MDPSKKEKRKQVLFFVQEGYRFAKGMHLQFFVYFFHMVVNRKITDIHLISHHLITQPG